MPKLLRIPPALCSTVAAAMCCCGADLDQPQPYKAARLSSAALDGSNRDAAKVLARSSSTIGSIDGAGRIVHIWLTLWPSEADYLRTTRLKIYWDNELQPSVDVPLGDFHALGHGVPRQVASSLFAVEARPPDLNHHLKQKNVASFHSYFPMPYERGARVEIQNLSERTITLLFFQIDYQRWPQAPSNLRFHAAYRESPPEPAPPPEVGKREASNRSEARNHLVLDAKGLGHFVGLVLSVDAMRAGWWEGDEVMTIDGEERPSIRGTGTEDYFGAAWGIIREFNWPWQGVSYVERIPDRNAWQAGKYTMYRLHERDPIPFRQSIRVSIERGHNNAHCDSGYSSVAYWYQAPSGLHASHKR